MNEEEFEECSVVAYPHEIRFLHIKGGRISYCVDRHISDYVNKIQQENKQLKEQLQQKEDIINKAKEFAKEHIFQFDGDKDFDALLEILDNKGKWKEKTNEKMVKAKLYNNHIIYCNSFRNFIIKL